MIDFFASATIALIIIMTLVLFLSNQRQAGILKQMRMVMEDWYDAQMRDRRKTFKEKINMPDPLVWLGNQVNLTVVDQARRLVNPPAAEFLSAEGERLVISPLSKGKLRTGLRNAEGKHRKVAKLVQPLLGYHPGRVEVIERSNQTVHEWYEVEIETALEKLNINWGEVKNLYFYVIPQEPELGEAPLISLDLQSIRFWFNQQLQKISSLFNQRRENHPLGKMPKNKTSIKPKQKNKAATANTKNTESEA